MGHLLNSRLLEGIDSGTANRREGLIRTLFSPEMLNISGIRTLSKLEKRFRPGEYHNGSVWLWDTNYIAQGLERQGYHGLAWELRARLWNDANITKRFPEFVSGGDDPKPVLPDRIVEVLDEKTGERHLIEQIPQEVQAWTLSAILASKYKYGQQIMLPATERKLMATDPNNKRFEAKILDSLPRRVFKGEVSAAYLEKGEPPTGKI